MIERHVALGEKAVLFEQLALPNVSEDDDLAALSYYEARKSVIDRFEVQYAPRLLERAGGNVTRAAELAKIGRPMLYRILARAGIHRR